MNTAGFAALEFAGGSALEVGPRADFLAALCARWSADPTLSQISAELYYDEAPDEVDPPYAVVSVPASKDRDRNTGRGFGVDQVVQFALYTSDQDLAGDLGRRMVQILDTIEDSPLIFADGYQRAWFWSGSTLRKVPGRGTGGTMVWQQIHLYRLTTGKARS